MEQYRFGDLARVLIATRPHLAPEAAVHLFGTGHPMTFAFAALFGVDLFDSSAYHKFARRGSLMFPEGTIDLDGLRESICRCQLCAERPLPAVRELPLAEQEAWIARHNLLISSQEVALVRQAIHDGNLWELAERRATGHPALAAGMRTIIGSPEIFLRVEPESRRSYREVGGTSLRRPAVERFRRRLAAVDHDEARKRPIPRVPLRPEYLRHLPERDSEDRPVPWMIDTEFGSVPLEYSDLYPVGPFLGVREFDSPRSASTVSGLLGPLQSGSPDLDFGRDWVGDWDRRQVLRSLEWEFGWEAANGLLSQGAIAERSRRTSRLRGIRLDGHPAFVIGNDGLPRPTWFGAVALQRLLPVPARRVVVGADAVPFVSSGRSLFSSFVLGADPLLLPDSSALLVDEGDRLLAVGRLLLAPFEMGRLRRGVAARITSHARSPTPVDEPELPVFPPLDPDRSPL